MEGRYFLTSESVGIGHPDKVRDLKRVLRFLHQQECLTPESFTFCIHNVARISEIQRFLLERDEKRKYKLTKEDFKKPDILLGNLLKHLGIELPPPDSSPPKPKI